MVWPIDAQKGRFPSKFAHSARVAGPEVIFYLSHSQTPTSDAPHTCKPGALLPATAVYPPLRAGSGCCSCTVAADIARCNLQYDRLRLLCDAPAATDHCAPCVRSIVNIRQSRRVWERMGAEFEAQQ